MADCGGGRSGVVGCWRLEWGGWSCGGVIDYVWGAVEACEIILLLGCILEENGLCLRISWFAYNDRE